jgi:hypothetical protein
MWGRLSELCLLRGRREPQRKNLIEDGRREMEESLLVPQNGKSFISHSEREGEAQRALLAEGAT